MCTDTQNNRLIEAVSKEQRKICFFAERFKNPSRISKGVFFLSSSLLFVFAVPASRARAEWEKMKSVNYAANVLKAEFGPFTRETLS
jgi:hypothetical protein